MKMIIHYLSESVNGCAATNANRLFKSIFLSLSLFISNYFLIYLKHVIKVTLKLVY